MRSYGELAAKEKARITRRVTAEVAAEYGFGGKTIPRPPKMLVSGSQGTGKTKLALEGVAEFPADQVVRYYAPTLAKAEEALRDYRRIATADSMPGMVVRGRGAADPRAPISGPGSNNVQMCRRFKAVERAARLGVLVRKTICPGCKYKTVCGTLAQEVAIAKLRGRGVYFMSREYAHLPCPAPHPDMVICDERMTLEAVTITTIEPDKLVGALVPYRGHSLPGVMAARRTLEQLRAPLMSSQPLAAIRDACIDKPQLQVLRRLLDAEETANVDGGMSDTEIERRLDRIDYPDRRHAAAIVGAVLREIDMPRATLNAIRYSRRRNLIMVSRLRRLDRTKNAAVMLLDGTGDLELNQKLMRTKLEHLHVRMERDADVTGTDGKRYSRQSITGKDTQGNNRSPDLVDGARRLRDDVGTIASHYETPFLSASKQAEEALVEGGHLPPDVMTSHGGMTRGRNTWEDRQTAISVGADALSIENLEILAGAFYARDPVPIVSMAARPEPADNWPSWPWPYRCTRGRRMRDGSVSYIGVDVHPDPRCQRVLEQIRESGVTQDLDRVRPVYNRRTLVALNQLVLDLTYDRVLSHRDLVAGGSRIDRVLQRTDGVLPLAPAVLASLFPDIFGSTRTAERALHAWRAIDRQTSNRTLYLGFGGLSLPHVAGSTTSR